MPDEAIYATRGIALWQHGSLSLHGQVASYGVLYPLLAGLPLSLGKVATGLGALKVVQAIGMSLVAVPLVVHGRRLMPEPYALVGAALAVASPLLLYSGLVMTEVAVLSALGGRAARDRTRSRDGRPARPDRRARADRGRRADARAGSRLRRRVRRRHPARRGVRALAAEAPARSGRSGRSPSPESRSRSRNPGIFGAYAVTVGGSYPIGAGLRLTYDHLAFLALSTALAPLAALVFLVARSASRPRTGSRARALIAVTVSVVVLVTAQVGFFAARFAPHLLGRDLAAVPPLLFLTSRSGSREARRVRACRCSRASPCSRSWSTAHWNSLASANALPDSFGIALLLRWHVLAPDNLVSSSRSSASACSPSALRRLSLLLPALMLAMLVASSAVAATRSRPR